MKMAHPVMRTTLEHAAASRHFRQDGPQVDTQHAALTKPLLVPAGGVNLPPAASPTAGCASTWSYQLSQRR